MFRNIHSFFSRLLHNYDGNSDLVTEIKPRALRNSMNIMITHYYIALMSHLQQQYDTQKIKHKCQVLFSKIFR